MALTLRVPPGRPPEIVQAFTSPSVYLDRWAIMRLSADEPLQQRFLDAMAKSSGTLLLGHLNFVEFFSVDANTAESAETFLDAALPHAYFSTMDLDYVLAREPSPRPGARTGHPQPDDALLKEVASRQLGARPYSVRGMLHATKGNPKLAKTMSELKAEIIAKIGELRRDPAHRRKAKNYKPTDETPRTQVVMAELLRSVHLDKQTTFGENDAIDLMHAVLSVSYCDFVLLDGPWKERVRQLTTRSAKYDPPVVPARCYSDRGKDMEQFIAALEAWGS